MKKSCQICGTCTDLTIHHLIPQHVSRHKNKYLKHSKENLIEICRPCHDQIHALFTETQLRDELNTLEKLLANPEFKKYVEWKKKHPGFTGHSKMSNDHKKRR